MSASALYGAIIAEHYKHPHNFGSLESPDVSQEGLNPLCGDRIRIELRLENGRISAARFRGDACMVVIASGSLLTDMVIGQTLEEARALPEEALLAALETTLRPARIACALLPLLTLRDAH